MKHTKTKFLKIPLSLLVMLIPGLIFARADTLSEGITLDRFPNSSRIAISGGVNVSRTLLKNVDFEYPELAIARFSGGITFDQQFSPRWFLSTGLLYEHKGYKREFYQLNNEGKPTGDPLETKVRLNYFSLPLLINFQIKGKVSYYLGAGIYTSLLAEAYALEPYFDADITVPPWKWETTGFAKRDMARNFTAMDFGVSLQTGLHTVVYDPFVAGFRVAFSHGLLSVSTQEQGYGDIKHVNRSLLITASLGYRF